MEKNRDAVWGFLRKGQEAAGEGGSLSGGGEHSILKMLRLWGDHLGQWQGWSGAGLTL